MSKPFEVSEDGKVRIARAAIQDNAQAALCYMNAQINKTEFTALAVLPLSPR